MSTGPQPSKTVLYYQDFHIKRHQFISLNSCSTIGPLSQLSLWIQMITCDFTENRSAFSISRPHSCNSSHCHHIIKQNTAHYVWRLCLPFKNSDISERLCSDSQPPPAITSTRCLIAAVLLRLTTTPATTLWPIQGAVLLLYFPSDASFKNGFNAT